MRESTDRVQSALYSDDPDEQLAASRLFESPKVFGTWENEHSELMRGVANAGLQRTQAVQLKKAAFQLIHRKALFEYLRHNQIRGSVRRRIVVYFHPTKDYAQSVVTEHGLYFRNTCSFICARHVGGNIVRDPGFFDPMGHYQALYAQYFQMFCSKHFGTDSANTDLQHELLPLLKYELEECRAAIMDPRPETERPKRIFELREPTGDTVRLPRLGGVKRKP